MLSAGPILMDVNLLGNADGCTGVVLTFDRALDPAHATDARSYVVGRIPPSPSDSGNLLGDIGNILAFAARPKRQPIRAGKVLFSTANYDPTTHAVTLIPRADFKAWKYFRLLRVRGSGPFALLDAQGNPFDGNADGTGGDDLVLHWHTKKGRAARYNDIDGDHVSLSLHGPGKLFVIERTRNDPFPMIFVEKVQANTVLNGKVVQSRSGNGVANIDQLSGISGSAATILNNPQFHVVTVFP